MVRRPQYYSAVPLTFGLGMYVVLFFTSLLFLSRARNVIVKSWVIRLATVLMLVPGPIVRIEKHA